MFSPDDIVGQELKLNLTSELQRRFNVGEDARDYADYIVMLMATGKSNSEVANETNEISSEMKIDEAFVGVIYQEAQNIIDRLQNQQNPAQQLPPQQPAPQPQSQPPSQPQLQPASAPAPLFTFPAGPGELLAALQLAPLLAFPDQIMLMNAIPKGPQIRQNRVTMNDGPKGLNKVGVGKARGGVGKAAGGVGKKTGNSRDYVANKEVPLGPRSQRAPKKPLVNFEKALAITEAQGNFQQKGRCPDHPNCSQPASVCEKGFHATQKCFSYPNCRNPPGTCKYLHEGEDGELIALLNEKKLQWVEKKKAQLQLQMAKCKFGSGCNKDLCPFVHPTPANPQAVVTTLDWCPQAKMCGNPMCTMAHPPPANAKPASQLKGEIALEQCRFGKNCTNFKCPRRHATSLAPCKFGNECRRLDCTYMHKLSDQCRFGMNCANPSCYYQHPEGFVPKVTATSWLKTGGMNLVNAAKQYAVPDDQVMEQVPQM